MRQKWIPACAIILLLAALPLASKVPQSSAGKSSASNSPATGPDRDAIQKGLENYLRNIYALDSTWKFTVTKIDPTPVDGLYKVDMSVENGGHSETQPFYVSRDGKYLLRAQLENLTTDPLSDVRKQMNLDDSPSKGPANAPITIVEYGDFECPSCRAAEPAIRAVLPKFPQQVRFVFKDFPLMDIHPWAMTAALAGRCIYDTNHDAFWKYHDLVYDHQDLISTANVYDKLLDYATQAGITDTASIRACMAKPETAQPIQASIGEGHRLQVANTPTIFVDGRRIVGGDQNILEQYIRYDLSSQPQSHP